MDNTSPRLTWERITLHLRNPFRLSYGTSETRNAHWLRLAGDEGWGEGTIPSYYGVDLEAMTAWWDAAAKRSERFPDDPARVAEWVGTLGPAPARAALDLALYDRIARRQNIPLYHLLELPFPESKVTSFTIAIDTPEEMGRLARQIAGYPVIKVKLGSDADDLARLAAVRAARPDARLRIDANAGWTRADALQHLKMMLQFDLELIEQPLAKEDIEGMGELQKHCPIPIVADESVQRLEDVEALAAAGVQGINLKLMKVGGLSPALRIVRRARELGLRLMLGCMIETSVGTTAMAHLMGLAEWLDLDAPLLVSDDPFDGIVFDEHGGVSIPRRTGIGVVRKEKSE